MDLFKDLYQRFQEPEPTHPPRHLADRQKVVTVIYEAMIKEEFNEDDAVQLQLVAQAYASQYHLRTAIKTWLAQEKDIILTDCLQLKAWAERCPWPASDAPEPPTPPSADPYKKYRL